VFERAVRLAERFGLESPVDRWTERREEIHREVPEYGTFHDDRNPALVAAR